MNKNKRIIEVFTAGCPVCHETLELVRVRMQIDRASLSGLRVLSAAVRYEVKALPTIVTNGSVVFEGRPSAEQANNYSPRRA